MQILNGNKHFTYNGMPVGVLLNDFWEWNSSDLLNNSIRSALSEFIVSSAIGLDTHECRENQNFYDMKTKSGIKIAVKSSAYLQNRNEKRLAKIRFGIRPTRSWDADTEAKRWSDLYVFCLYTSKDHTESPLQLENWEFYVLPTNVIDKKCGTNKSISLTSLLSLKPIKTPYGDLKSTIENLSLNFEFSTDKLPNCNTDNPPATF